jgi:hypothetical protein
MIIAAAAIPAGLVVFVLLRFIFLRLFGDLAS